MVGGMLLNNMYCQNVAFMKMCVCAAWRAIYKKMFHVFAKPRQKVRGKATAR